MEGLRSQEFQALKLTTQTPKAHCPRYRVRQYSCKHFWGVWDTKINRYAKGCTRMGLAPAMRKAKELNNYYSKYGE